MFLLLIFLSVDKMNSSWFEFVVLFIEEILPNVKQTDNNDFSVHGFADGALQVCSSLTDVFVR